MKTGIIKARLEYWEKVYEKYQKAYIELIEGNVKYYMIDDRQLTHQDLDVVAELLEKAEQKIDELEAMLSNAKPRKAVGIVPRDW